MSTKHLENQYIFINAGLFEIYGKQCDNISRLVFKILVEQEVKEGYCDQVHVFWKSASGELPILKITMDTVFSGWDGAFWCVHYYPTNRKLSNLRRLEKAVSEMPDRSLGACIRFLLSVEDEIVAALEEGIYDCAECGGYGNRERYRTDRQDEATKCPVCNGTGRLIVPMRGHWKAEDQKMIEQGDTDAVRSI